MTAATLSLLALCGLGPGPGPDPDPTTLIAQLGSARFVERERATTELEEIGPEALPALRVAKDARDPEVRARAEAIIGRIELRRLTRPTLVRLDLRDRTLPEVVLDLRRQTGFHLRLEDDLDPAARDRRVTLRADAPVPFWEALDKLCAAAELRRFDRKTRDETEPTIVLADGEGLRPRPGATDGPFHAAILDRRRQPDQMARNRPGGGMLAQLRIQLVAEPGILLRRAGPWRVVEAVDDRQNTLPTPPDELIELNQLPRADRIDPTALGSFQGEVWLRLPNRGGAKLDRLRVATPLVAAARRPDPLVVRLADAAGKSFTVGETALRFNRVETEPGSGVIELLVRSPEPAFQLPDPNNLGGPGFRGGFRGRFPLELSDALQLQIEVVDARGRPCPWEHEPQSGPNGRFRMMRLRGFRIGEDLVTIRVSPPEDSEPVEFRFYSLMEASTEPTFEFDNITLP
ncbi:MAG TPA: hypothetical protein VG406_05830 [Isosphaeraceae bacterium]|nr:hypothetical protein [Isosphaeraceae bacterium]